MILAYIEYNNRLTGVETFTFKNTTFQPLCGILWPMDMIGLLKIKAAYSANGNVAKCHQALFHVHM